MHLLSTTRGPFTSKPIMHTSFIEYPLKICACHARFNWETLRYVQQAKRSEEIRSRRGDICLVVGNFWDLGSFRRQSFFRNGAAVTLYLWGQPAMGAVGPLSSNKG